MKLWAQITDFVILNDHFFKKKIVILLLIRCIVKKVTVDFRYSFICLKN